MVPPNYNYKCNFGKHTKFTNQSLLINKNMDSWQMTHIKYSSTKNKIKNEVNIEIPWNNKITTLNWWRMIFAIYKILHSNNAIERIHLFY